MTGHLVPHCNWYHLWGQVTAMVAASAGLTIQDRCRAQ